ncbi:unnamed protein product [Protopolystoma xenopodis]|uniref:Rho-GAP domain-containing protein n=1 Tax=Protopolystoma xenopodis TaxID=117903 RepID=A0A3S5C1F2_9PLAT|nr:unnamed protein product [Protopolystoma xenopodis]
MSLLRIERGTMNSFKLVGDLLVFIAREGVAVTDLFRRPGNPQDMKKIISDLESCRVINWTDYNFYTLANIAKRFLLYVDGGLLGAAAEEALLNTLDLPDDQSRIEAMHRQAFSISTAREYHFLDFNCILLFSMRITKIV